jgi:hypothetical protein
MLWRTESYEWRVSASTLRANNWRDVLADCARHDPDNALYDYVAACFYWESSAQIDYYGAVRIDVRDVDMYRHAQECFERGLRKRFFAVSDAEQFAAERFVTRSKAPRFDQAIVIEGRYDRGRRDAVLNRVLSWQTARAMASLDADDPTAGRAELRDLLQVVEQATLAAVAHGNEPSTHWRCVYAAAEANKLFAKHGIAASAEETARYDSLERQVRFEDLVTAHSHPHLPRYRPRNRLTRKLLNPLAQWAAPVCSSAVVALILAGGATIGGGRLLRGRKPPPAAPLNLVFQAAAFLGAAVLTFVVFGLGASEAIPRRAQAWGLTIILLTAPALVAIGFAYVLLRSRRATFSLRAMMCITFTLGVVFGAAILTKRSADAFEVFPFDLAIPFREAPGWAKRTTRRDFAAAHFQWMAWHGAYMTIGLWVILLTAIYFKSAPRDRAGNLPLRRREVAGSWMRYIGRSLLTAAVVLLLCYLALAPQVVSVAEGEYQTTLASARHPAITWSTMEAKKRAVRRDATWMNQFRAQVETDMYREHTPRWEQ